MPISRALLNRLRLPYKALDIQGSKGDVLYIPDDVGVDLSVMHGVHNGDMVPVKTDANGVVSVAVDNSTTPIANKEQSRVITSEVATLTEQHTDIDTSKFSNYTLAFVIDDGPNSALAIHFTILMVVNGLGLFVFDTADLPTQTNSILIHRYIPTINFVLSDTTRIKYFVSGVGVTPTFSVYAIGWN